MVDDNTRFTIAGFDCPIHGMEIGAFCFRGFQPENIEQWRLYEVGKGRPMSFEEVKAMFPKERP